MPAFVTVQCPKCSKARDISAEESRREQAETPFWVPMCDDCHFPMFAISARSS